jgi:signal transduction histidine kinase
MMRMHRSRPRAARRPRLPRGTARLQLTVLYGAAFLVCGACGAAVLAVTVLLYGHLTPPKIQESRVEHRTVISSAAPSAVPSTSPSPGEPAGVHVAVAGLGQLTIDRQQLTVISVIAVVVFVVGAAVLGWLLAGRVLRPLSTITAAARRISASSLHERLSLRGPDDELKELADTLDNLFARLEASFDAQRRFAANASHELRTPLTRERTLLQVTLADPDSTASAWQAIGRELLASNAEQERLIDALLTLASSEAADTEHEPLDLAVITSAALAAARPAISRAGLRVETALEPAAVDGDPLLVQQLAANLIDNAVRHNIPGGDIRVSTGISDGQAFLSVANSGQLIPATEVERLFHPFQRLGPRPSRRDGSHGLGLSIVRAIATAQGAIITAQPRPGGGLTIDVTFSGRAGTGPAGPADEG